MRIRSGAVVALFAFNVSVSSSWLKTTPMLQRDASAISTAATTLAKAAPNPKLEPSVFSTAAGAEVWAGQAYARRVDDRHYSTSTSPPINSPAPSSLGAGIIICSTGEKDLDVVPKCIYRHLVDIPRIRAMVQFSDTLSTYAAGHTTSRGMRS